MKPFKTLLAGVFLIAIVFAFTAPAQAAVADAAPEVAETQLLGVADETGPSMEVTFGIETCDFSQGVEYVAATPEGPPPDVGGYDTRQLAAPTDTATAPQLPWRYAFAWEVSPFSRPVNFAQAPPDYVVLLV